MRIAAALLSSVFILSGCDPLGRPCDEDDDCGPGYDCYFDECVQVCTKNDECREGQNCYRYHCITPGEKPGRRKRTKKTSAAAPASPPATRRSPPPVPDATIAELRAIRRELELLRHEQRRLAEMMAGKPDPGSPRPTRPNLGATKIRLPPKPPTKGQKSPAPPAPQGTPPKKVPKKSAAEKKPAPGP